MSLYKIKIFKFRRNYLDTIIYKDANIIFHSEEIKKFDSLHQFFLKNGVKHYKKSDIESTTEDVQNYIKVYGVQILENSRKEFKSTDKMLSDRDDFQCELCKQVNLKSLYLVENKFNGKQFWVGTQCIKEFGFENNRKVKDVALLKKFDDEIPDYKQLVELLSVPIIVPNGLYSKYKSAISDFVQSKDKFIKSKNGSSEDLKICLIAQDKLKSIIEELNSYVEKNKNNTWSVNSEVIKWFENLSPKTKFKREQRSVINRIKENGICYPEDIALLKETSHVNKVRKIFISLLENSDYIFGINNNSLIATNIKTGIEYKVNEEALYKKYQEEIYNFNTIEIERDFLNLVTVNKTIDNIIRILQKSKGYYHIESFIMSEGKVFVNKDKYNLYVLKIDDLLNYLKSHNSINDYLKKRKKSKYISKEKFNDLIDNFDSYKNRYKIHPQPGVRK